MCHITDPLTIPAMENEVQRRIAARDMFTALDISRAVQSLGICERHRDLKHVVHEMFARNAMGADYERTLVTVGQGEQAYLYHPLNTDPTLYAHGTQAISRMLPAAHPTTARNAPGSTVRFIDRWLRLRLPAPLLRRTGAKPGDLVYIELDSTDGRLSVTTGLPASSARRYRVDRYGNVRISLGNSVPSRRFQIALVNTNTLSAQPI